MTKKKWGVQQACGDVPPLVFRETTLAINFGQGKAKQHFCKLLMISFFQ